MYKDKFLDSIISFYETWFNNGEHEICCFSNENGFLLKADYSIKIYSFSYDELSKRRFYAFLKKYDYIVLHSAFLDVKSKLLFLANQLLKKTIWIEWGYDLYDCNSNDKKKNISYLIDYYFKSHVSTAICIFEPDIMYFKKVYHRSKSEIFYAPYTGPNIPKEFNFYSEASSLESTNKKNETVYIQIGHQATKQINHINVLKMLSKYKDENIKIVLPLSYGDKDNAITVSKAAIECFGTEKTIILSEMLTKDDYFELTKRIDIAIFDTDRQIGLANINRFIFRNTKLFLTRGSVMYDYFLTRGVPVLAVQDIENMDFSDFKSVVKPVNKELFMSYISTLSNYDWKLDCWMKIYKHLENKLK